MSCFEQDVVGLDVAVDHPVLMGEIQRIRHFARDPDRLAAGTCLALEPRQGTAFDERADVVQEHRPRHPSRRAAGYGDDEASR